MYSKKGVCVNVHALHKCFKASFLDKSERERLFFITKFLTSFSPGGPWAPSLSYAKPGTPGTPGEDGTEESFRGQCIPRAS